MGRVKVFDLLFHIYKVILAKYKQWKNARNAAMLTYFRGKLDGMIWIALNVPDLSLYINIRGSVIYLSRFDK